MKNICSLLSLSFSFSGLLCTLLLSGCIAQKQTGEKSLELGSLEQQNQTLKEQNTHLQRELGDQKAITSQLQLALLGKHAEVNRLLIKNERLVNEFVLSKSKVRSHGNKVETVRLLAEVAAVIDTLKANDKDGVWKSTIKRAEQHLKESQAELDKQNFEGATFLANQALDLTQSAQLEKTKEDVQQQPEVSFLAHMAMMVLENSNVRQGPSISSAVQFVQKAGTTVTAVGYKGLWVKISLKDDKFGWIHYSLLSSARK